MTDAAATVNNATASHALFERHGADEPSGSSTRLVDEIRAEL